MDTRSVIRSRRKSARLKSQPHDDKAEKQSMPKRRVSNTRLSTTKSATPKPTKSSATTIKQSKHTTETPPTMTSKSIGTAKSSKNGECVINTPIFPNLSSTKNTRLDTRNMQTRVDHGGARQTKSVQGMLQPIDDTPPYNLSDDRGLSVDGAASLPESRRRSARLARSMPGVADMESPVTDVHVKTEHTLATMKTIATTKESLNEGSTDKSISPVTTQPQDRPQRVLPLYSSNSSLTDLVELPPYERLSVADNPADEDDFVEKTSPIPELMADIARIIETSSPVAARVSTNDSQYTTNTTPLIQDSAVRPSVTSPLALAGACSARNPTEADNEAEQDFSLVQQSITDPLLPTFAANETYNGGGVSRTCGHTEPRSCAVTPDTYTESQYQIGSPRGIKRGAEELNPDEQTLARHQLATPSRPLSVPDFPSTVNLIEAAASRDCYEIEDDDELDNSLWMDGQTGYGGRPSRSQEDLDSDEYVHLTGTYGSTQNVHLPPQPQQQTDTRRTTDRISTHRAEHDPASSSQTAGYTAYLHDISKCADCGKTPMKFLLCVRCLKTRYCGKYCQIWDWPFHRRMCDASEKASPGEVTKQREYLDEMWAGALRMLKEKVIDTDHETVGSKENQPPLQSHAKSSLVGLRAGGNIVEQGMALLGTASGAVTQAGGAGQQRRIFSAGDGSGARVAPARDHQPRDDIDDEEGGVVFRMPPPSPKSMFQSRAMALRLAQIAEF
ncbi:MYND-type zinc finger protein MUB1 [Cytospora mali]|uniref:MYND-type zinc finger protein MUB1 n=1 Tax=Cytospora mali TaxID=578113 RepID=A0A194VSX0_CYTMA|nr:MYND-type zinc finger protein MUB1 [Valsa mali]